MFLVTGATGTVGSEVLRLLCEAGHPARALVRSPERADNLRGFDCAVAVGDFADPDSLDEALEGVHVVFLVCPVGPQQVAHETAVIEAVERAGGARVVKVATIGYAQGLFGRVGEAHRTVVERLAAAGLPHTVLAANDFFQDLLGRAAEVRETGVLAAPADEAAVSSVDARDVAAVAAHVLTSDGHDGNAYTLTGPESLTWAERAVRLSAVVERDVRYVAISPEEARVALLAGGLSEWHADAVLEVYAGYRSGAVAAVTDEVRAAIGRAPRRLDEFLDQHRAAFRPVDART